MKTRAGEDSSLGAYCKTLLAGQRGLQVRGSRRRHGARQVGLHQQFADWDLCCGWLPMQPVWRQELEALKTLLSLPDAGRHGVSAFPMFEKVEG